MDDLEMCREAGRKAAHGWPKVADHITLDDHKLNSLFNFEQDILAIIDRDPKTLKRRHAFLEGFDSVASVIFKTGARDYNTIYIEGKRKEKFCSLLADIADTATSLKTAARLFPKDVSIAEGELSPLATTISYACVLGDMITAVMNIATDEDLKDAAREADHAQD